MIETGKQRVKHRRIQGVIRQASIRWGLVFMDDRIVVPVDLRRRLLDILQFGQAGITKMLAEAKIFGGWK